MCCSRSKVIVVLILFVQIIIGTLCSGKICHRDPVVTTQLGKVRGVCDKLVDGSSYYRFRGIPYATPPVGDLRFKGPLPPSPWQGIRDAIEFGNTCAQFNETYQGDEDCLFLNVYTKSLRKHAKIPVMVFIHGGSFSQGSGNFFLSDFLLQHDYVILVTLNYRLEVLGFMTLDTPEAPGNAGMKDQVAALRWVKDNIAQFGGDPDSVTLFGESSGAAAAVLHMFSPMSKGLFHRVIAQSGTYDLARREGEKERAIRAAKVLGKDTNDVQELLQFFRSIEASRLTNLTIVTLTDDERFRGLPAKFVPVIEKKFANVQPFMDEDPTKMLAEGRIVNKVPLMIGYNSGEGLIMTQFHAALIDVYNRQPSFYVPKEIVDEITQNKLTDFGNRVKKFYVGDRDIAKDDFDVIRDIQTDIHFSYTTHRLTDLYSKFCPQTYMYRFDAVTELNVIKNSLNLPDVGGVSHADELFYLFFNYLNEKPYREQKRLKDIVFKVTKLWTDFAKTSRPTPDCSTESKWQPYTVKEKEFYIIDEQFSKGKYADRQRMEFWNQLYIEAGLPHISKSQSAPVVTVREGKLRGTTYSLVDDSTCYVFRGIPFARPPVGDLRFKAPLPPTPWRGIRDATNFGDICTQYNTTYQGSEDCLFLNIYTKSLQPNAKIPVMVWIYGGSYYEGSGDFFLPDFLMLHDVLLVTFNYRLDMLGFLSLETAEAPGNAGMKDQVAALRWIRNNIANFGGDPNSVTLFGESSGASSVTYHMFSPMSAGLFHKVIAQSGVCIHDWAIGRGAKARAFRAGKILGTETNDVQVLLNYFKGLDAKALTNLTVATLTPDEKYRGLPEQFIPVIEKKFPNVEAFITENPVKMLVEGKVNRVPLMLGYNSGEGLIILPDHLTKLDVYNKEPSFYVPREIAEKISKDQLKDFGDRIKKFYVGNRNITEADSNTIVDMQTDMHFSYNTHRFAHLYAKLGAPTYLYRFDAVTDLNIIKIALELTHLKGVSHADELWYLFYNYLNDKPYAEQAKLKDIVYRVTKLWADFAKTGNPTPDCNLGAIWQPYTTNGKEYYKIDESFSLCHRADNTRIMFWDKLYEEACLPHIS